MQMVKICAGPEVEAPAAWAKLGAGCQAEEGDVGKARPIPNGICWAGKTTGESTTAMDSAVVCEIRAYTLDEPAPSRGGASRSLASTPMGAS